MDKIDKVLTAVDTASGWVASLPVSVWYGLGLLVAIAIIVSSVLEAILEHHKIKYDEKLTKRMITVLLGFLSFLGSASDVLLTNSVFIGPLIHRFAYIGILAVGYHHFIGNAKVRQFVNYLAQWSGAKNVPVSDVADTPAPAPVVQPVAVPSTPSQNLWQ
jgi:hypothetical protein